MEIIREENNIIVLFDGNALGLGVENKNKTDAEIEQIALLSHDEIKYNEANPPEQTVEEKRKKDYEEQGITIDKLIIALWELVVEERPEAVNLLQAERLKVKQKFPKE